MPNGSGKQAMTEWVEFQKIKEKEKESEAEVQQEKWKYGKWSAPRKGWIKLNTDAALNQRARRAGWGIVARDWRGKLVASWACPSFTCSEPKLEEALAIRTAMGTATVEGWEKVIIETNCKTVVDKLENDAEDAVISTVLQDIKLLKYSFDECCFSFIRRKQLCESQVSKICSLLERCN